MILWLRDDCFAQCTRRVYGGRVLWGTSRQLQFFEIICSRISSDRTMGFADVCCVVRSVGLRIDVRFVRVWKSEV